MLCTFSRCADEQEAKETALPSIPSTNGYRRCTVPGKASTRSIVYEHGIRFERDCSGAGLKKQRYFCASFSSCRAASIQPHINLHITHTFALVQGFRSYTSHMLERTRMFRRERDTMSYVFAIRLFSLDELKSIAHPYMFHG